MQKWGKNGGYDDEQRTDRIRRNFNKFLFNTNEITLRNSISMKNLYYPYCSFFRVGSLFYSDFATHFLFASGSSSSSSWSFFSSSFSLTFSSISSWGSTGSDVSNAQQTTVDCDSTTMASCGGGDGDGGNSVGGNSSASFVVLILVVLTLITFLLPEYSIHLEDHQISPAQQCPTHWTWLLHG